MKKKVNAPRGFHWMKSGRTFKLMRGGYKPHKGSSKFVNFPIQKTHTK